MHESLQGCGDSGKHTVRKTCLKLPKILNHYGKFWYWTHAS